MTERRLAQRYDLYFPICAFEEHTDGRVNGTTRNLSTGGIYFVLDAPAYFFGEFSLIMTLPGAANSDVSMHARARIVRIEETSGANSRIGVAVIVSEYAIHHVC